MKRSLKILPQVLPFIKRRLLFMKLSLTLLGKRLVLFKAWIPAFAGMTEKKNPSLVMTEKTNPSPPRHSGSSSRHSGPPLVTPAKAGIHLHLHDGEDKPLLPSSLRLSPSSFRRKPESIFYLHNGEDSPSSLRHSASPLVIPALPSSFRRKGAPYAGIHLHLAGI